MDPSWASSAPLRALLGPSWACRAVLGRSWAILGPGSRAARSPGHSRHEYQKRPAAPAAPHGG
eukprot:5442587-Pyramimonas_sp.AAC.1